MKKGKFDFDDYLESMKQMRNMGGLASILKMLPGMGWSKVHGSGIRRAMRSRWPG